MQFNAASPTSSFAAASAIGATRSNLNFNAVDVDGFKVPQLPLSFTSHQPIEKIKFTKIPGLLSPTESDEQKNIAPVVESDRFPSPGDSGDEGHVFEDADTHPSLQPASWRAARSVAPSPAPSILPQIHDDIERLYALEAKQAEEIRSLAKDLLAEAYNICLSTSEDLAGHYRQKIAELLGEGVEKRVVEDAEELKEIGRLPERQPAWDFGYFKEARPSRAPTNLATPTRTSMPPRASIPSRKRLREEDSLEDVLEVENSLSLSRNASIATISSTEASPATKRPRLDSYEPTIDESEDDAMLGLIWGRYFQTADHENDDEEYSPSDEEMDLDDSSDSSIDMEAEAEDLSIFALTRGLPDDLVGFIEEAILCEADRLAEEAPTAVPPSSPPPAASTPFPIHSFGTAEERPPVPAPRPVPQVPRRLQRSNERVTINEDGSIEAVDYTQTEEYAARMAWERHIFVVHGRSGRGGPCDLAADLREITQVGPGGELLNCHRWRYRFDEQAWKDFEVPS
ncbi:unnamed protein product [Cyclocybe aegerita]|uniref:Uncharacterized protein n=1 Tax=Cyclocybe aegerita TaxID=1973307 RepID=A0A8S0VRS1_CYCAE|nr:unnamed protein product [Cyclocybe aegerita]